MQVREIFQVMKAARITIAARRAVFWKEKQPEWANQGDIMSDSRSLDRDFTPEELEQALPYRPASFHFFRKWYDPAYCPHCDNALSEKCLKSCGPCGKKYPRAIFARCPRCGLVYFRPNCQEPALAEKTADLSFMKYIPCGMAAGGILILGAGLLGAVPLPCFPLFMGPATVISILSVFLAERGVTKEEVRNSRNRLKNPDYAAAMMKRGLSLPDEYVPAIPERNQQQGR